MNLWRALLAFFLFFNVAFANAHNVAPVIGAQELSALVELPGVRIVDIRSANEYEQAHIPQAVSAPYEKWRGPAQNPGQLVETEYLQQLIRDLGIDNDDHVIVYSTGDSQTDFGAAARVYWTLKYAGLASLSVLDGGYQQWQQAQLPTRTDSPTFSASQFVVKPNSNIVIFKDELVKKVNEASDPAQIIDARPKAFFEGQTKAPTASVPGTIAGAINAQHQQWFNADSATLKPVSEIKQLVRTQKLDQAPETISFCNTGHWAATNWFVLSEVAGLDHVRLYPASLAEWTQSEIALPMDNTPSRTEQIRTKFQQLIKK